MPDYRGFAENENSPVPYRLTDHIAKRRIIYPPPVPTVASVLVIEIPTDRRGPGLSLGRYYAIFAETDAEVGELERFLAAPRDGARAPDLLDRRASTLHADRILLIRYDPPAPGWPWLSACRWPEAGSLPPEASRGDMARGCYTMEMFETPSALESHQASVLATLARDRPVDVLLVAGDRLGSAGNC